MVCEYSVARYRFEAQIVVGTLVGTIIASVMKSSGCLAWIGDPKDQDGPVKRDYPGLSHRRPERTDEPGIEMWIWTGNALTSDGTEKFLPKSSSAISKGCIVGLVTLSWVYCSK